MYEAGLQPTCFSYAKSLVQPLGFVSNISKFKMSLKIYCQLSSLFVLLSTSVIAEVILTADEVKAVLIKVEYGFGHFTGSSVPVHILAKWTQPLRIQEGDSSHCRIYLTVRMDPKLWLLIEYEEGLADATIIKKNAKSLKVTMWMPASGPLPSHFPSPEGNIIAEATARRLPIKTPFLDAHQRSMNKRDKDPKAKKLKRHNKAALINPRTSSMPCSKPRSLGLVYLGL